MKTTDLKVRNRVARSAWERSGAGQHSDKIRDASAMKGRKSVGNWRGYLDDDEFGDGVDGYAIQEDELED